MLPSLRRIKKRKGNPWGWHWVCGPRGDLQPRHPGAGCLGGPCGGLARSSSLVQSACGQGRHGRLGQLKPSHWLPCKGGRLAGPSPKPSVGSQTPLKPWLPPKSKGDRGFSRQGPTCNSQPHPFPNVYTGPAFPPPTLVQECQHMHHPSKEASCQLERGGKNTGRPEVPRPFFLQLTNCVTLGN